MLQLPLTGRNLIARVADSLSLEGDDRTWLLAACVGATCVAADTDLARQGEQADNIHLILSGMAVRYRVTREGGQQNLGFIVPGNFCDLHAALLQRNDHSIKTLSACEVATIARQELLATATRSTGLMRAFWWCALLNAAILREWIVILAVKPAEERVAHLFCELHARLEAVGFVQPDNSFLFPVTQQDLADTLGLSAVHVNRTLKALREEGMLRVQRFSIQIPDVNRLRQRADFNPTYLQLGAKPG